MTERVGPVLDEIEALIAEVRRLASELAGVRVELERTEGDWAVAIREATRARAEVELKQASAKLWFETNEANCADLKGERDAVRNEALDLRLLNVEMVAALHEVYERVAVFLVEHEYQFGEKQAILLVLSTAIANRAALSVAATDTEETP